MPYLGSPRHIGIAFITGIAILIAGILVFGESNEVAMRALALVSFFSVFAVFHFLDERAKRRAKKRRQ